MTRKTAALVTMILTAYLAVWSQGTTAVVYRIASIKYHITGKTKERPLRDNLELNVGKEFKNLYSLEAYVADRRQELANERIFASSDLTYALGDVVDGVAPVTLVITIKDSWNLIALPYPKGSTNDGLSLSIKLRDYNFLGSMETLYLDTSYIYDEYKRSSLGLGVEFTLPFGLLGQDWSFTTDHGFAYALSGLITYTDVETLKLYLQGDKFLWTVRMSQGFLWNEDGESDDDLNKLVLQTLAGIGTQVDIFSVKGLGPVALIPDLEVGQEYLANGDMISSDRRGPYITASYTLDAGRADWVGNFRKGLTLTFNNSYTYNLQSDSFGISTTLTESYYNVLGKRVGLNSQVKIFKNFLTYSEEIGNNIRGVPDTQIDGDFAVFGKLDLPIHLFDFKPSLLIKKDWFDFEAHASPFMDAALVNFHPTSGDSYLKPYLTGGLELFGFLKKARSIYARISLGVNILGYMDTHSMSGNWEYFFGLGHDY